MVFFSVSNLNLVHFVNLATVVQGTFLQDINMGKRTTTTLCLKWPQKLNTQHKKISKLAQKRLSKKHVVLQFIGYVETLSSRPKGMVKLFHRKYCCQQLKMWWGFVHLVNGLLAYFRYDKSRMTMSCVRVRVCVCVFFFFGGRFKHMSRVTFHSSTRPKYTCPMGKASFLSL